MKHETKSAKPETGNTPTLMTVITPPPKSSPIASKNESPGTFDPDSPTLYNLEPGTSWGPFEIKRAVGYGAMGTVYEARDTLLDRHVALKILVSPRPEDRSRGLCSCLHEARIAARLDHPNIVTIYHVGEHAGYGFIAMQLVRGKSAASGWPFTIERSIQVIRPIAVALSHAHNQGLVHRDVKPENFLLGDDGSVKLADFGLAQVKTLEGSGSTPDRVVGTPAYISPEQVQGLKLDGRADLYSLGATWFTLLTGRAPFPGSNVVEVLFAHVKKPAPDIREIRPDVPGSIARLIGRLLSKEPNDRPASAEELIACIDALPPATARSGRPIRKAIVASLFFCSLAFAFLLSYSAGLPKEEKAPCELTALLPSTAIAAAPEPRPVITRISSGHSADAVPSLAPEPSARKMMEPTAPAVSPPETKPATVTTLPIESDESTAAASNESPVDGRPTRLPPSVLGVTIVNTQLVPKSNPYPFGVPVSPRRPPNPGKLVWTGRNQ